MTTDKLHTKTPLSVSLVLKDKLLESTIRCMIAQTPRWTFKAFPDLKHSVLPIFAQLPDVLLTDFHCLSLCGLETTHKLRSLMPRLAIVTILNSLTRVELFFCVTAGASGCLVKPITTKALRQALAKAAEGRPVLSEDDQTLLLNTLSRFPNDEAISAEAKGITAREKTVLALLAVRSSDKEIADVLMLSPGTIHTHVASLFKKLRVHRRQDLVSRFFRFL